MISALFCSLTNTLKKAVLLIGFISPVCAQLAMGQSALEIKTDSLNELSFKLRESDQNKAIKIAQEAFRSAPKSYTSGLMNAQLNLGINHALMNRIDSSHFYLRKVQEHFENNPIKSGLVHYYLGLGYGEIRNFKKAEALLNDAIQLFQEAASIEFLAEAHNSYGILHARQGNDDDALAYFSKAYEVKLANQLRYDKELANIAIVYRGLKKYDKALDFAYQSLARSAHFNDSLGMVQTMVTIGNIYSSAQQFDSAKFIYDKALDISVKNHYSKQIASILHNKAVIAERSGEITQALTSLKQIIKKVEEGDQLLEKPYYEIARILMKKKAIDSSIFYANKSYSISRKYNNPNMAKLSAKLLSNNYREKKQLDSALKYHHLFVLHQDTLYARNNQSLLSDMRIRIETLEQENQIIQLKQEKELDRLRKNWLISIVVVTLIIGILIIIMLIYRHRNKLKTNALKQEKLQAEIQQSQSELSQQTLHMIHLNNCLNQIENQLKSAKRKSSIKDEELAQLLASIKLNKSLDKDWENFTRYFSKVHAEFTQKFPSEQYGLTKHEQRACELLILGLSNREIATILNIQAKSVIMLRYRIKKKLQLEKEQDLEDYLKQL